MQGSYVLVLRLPRTASLSVGGLGRVEFRRGYYAYVGSALNGLEGRIRRHLRRRKRMHWHIDYLSKRARVEKAFYVASPNRRECAISGRLAQFFMPISEFGSTDCGCNSHLFFSPRYARLERAVRRSGMRAMNLENLTEAKGL